MSATLTSAGAATARSSASNDKVSAPTIADAQRVADAFAEDPNVVRVLLFGSVARGEQHVGSDIDLVVIHADLDYAKRHEVEEALRDQAKEVTARRAEVEATDLPEWTMRTETVKNSFEASLLERPLLTLFSRSTDGYHINWAKEQVLDTDCLAIALDFMTFELDRKLYDLELHLRTHEAIREEERGDPELVNIRAFNTGRAAALVIEVAINSQAKLATGELLPKEPLRVARKAIDDHLSLLKEPYLSELRGFAATVGLEQELTGTWRKPPDVLELVLYDNVKRPDAAVSFQVAETAIAVADVVLQAYEWVTPANGSGRDEVDSTRESWQFVKDAYETIDIRTAEPRPTPLDLTPMLQGHRDALARALEGASADEATAQRGATPRALGAPRRRPPTTQLIGQANRLACSKGKSAGA